MAALTRWADLVLALILIGSVALSAPYFPLQPGLLQIALGFVFLLFVPGYLMALALFPRRTDVSGLDRTVLSVGLSVVTVPLIALILNSLPGGVTPSAMAQGLCVWAVVWVGVSAWRRSQHGSAAAFIPPMTWQGLRPAALPILASLAVVIGLGNVMTRLHASVPVTEFFLMDTNGQLADYPRQISANGVLSLTLGVRNAESRAMSYLIRSEACQTALKLPVLKPGQEWRQVWNCSAQKLGGATTVRFDLLVPENPRSYRTVLVRLKPTDCP